MLTDTKILLADDDGDDRELFSEALVSLGTDVTYLGAEDGQKAIDILDGGANTQPSIIFLDINMPVMTGWEVLRKIKTDSSYTNIPVIVYSTSSGEKDKQIAFDLGAICFVTKPDNIKKIRAMLQIVIDTLKSNAVTADMCLAIHRTLRQA